MPQQIRWVPGIKRIMDIDNTDISSIRIEDADADYLLRTNAVTCAKTHGTAEQFASLAEVVNGLTDNKAEQIQKAYNDAAAGN